MRRLIASLLVLHVAGLGLAPEALAAGFRITAHGAKAMGMAGAFAAQADDPSAVYYNPAGISQLEGTQIQGGITFIHSPGSEYEPFNATTPTLLANGTPGVAAAAQIDSRTFYLPVLFVTHRANERLSLAFGTYTPFGLQLDWPDDWTGRQITTFSESQTSYFDFVAAYDVLPWWTVSAGVVYARSKVKLQRTTFNNPPTTAESLVQIDAYGWAPTFDLGTHLRLTDRIRIGAAYRHQAVVEHNGWVHLKPQAGLLAFEAGPDLPASTKFALPSTFTAGIAVKPLDRWTVEFDWDWTNWSSFNHLNVDIPGSVVVEPGLEASGPFPNRRWKDSHIFKLGTQFEATRALALRVGAAYYTTPIPDETLDPVLPDSVRTGLMAGFGYRFTDSLSFDLAYEYQHFHERAKNNNVLVTNPPTLPGLRANGTYNTDAHVLLANVKYMF